MSKSESRQVGTVLSGEILNKFIELKTAMHFETDAGLLRTALNAFYDMWKAERDVIKEAAERKKKVTSEDSL